MSDMFSDIDTERNVISYLLTDTDTYENEHSKLSSNLFDDDRLKTILSKVNTYYLRYGGLPDTVGLEEILNESSDIPKSKRPPFILLYSELKSRSSGISRDKFLSGIERLKKLDLKRKLYEVANTVKEGLQSEQREDELYSKVLSKIYEVGNQETNVLVENSIKLTIRDRINKYQELKDNPHLHTGIPLGIRQLDDLTSGILPGEFAIFFGRSGAGKSRTLFSLAYNMFSRGYNVMYVTIEMPYNQVARMFDSRHFQVSSENLRKGKVTHTELEKMRSGVNKLQALSGDFYIVDIPGGCTSASLIPIIRKYKARKKMDVIVVDYINLMKPVDSSFSSRDPGFFATIAKELKAVARLEDLVILSATQANNAVVKEKLENVGQEHVYNSGDLIPQCDLAVFLRKPNLENELQRQLDAVVVKYRDGKNMKLQLGVVWDLNFVGDLEDLLVTEEDMNMLVVAVEPGEIDDKG